MDTCYVCLIQTEKETDVIMLDFDQFKLTSRDSDCQDSLELRYNLPGQPGVRSVVAK